jgi:hypothetical protein
MKMKNAVPADDWATVAITMTQVAQNWPKCGFALVSGWQALGEGRENLKNN